MTPFYEQPWPEGEYRLFQLGFVVTDVLAASARWAAVHGIGPFHVFRRRDVPCTYRGERSAIDVAIGTAQAGPVQIELIEQQCDRPSIYRELFPAGQHGFHQLCTVTPDYDAKVARYAGLGYELACEFGEVGERVAYLDTLADLGYYTELIEEEPRFLASVAAIARTCAAWDGTTDPVRILTRDGYRTP